MKTAVITGVSGGMGFAAAKELLRKGYQVFGLDIREPGAASASGLQTGTAVSRSGLQTGAYSNQDPGTGLPSPAGLHYIKTDLTDLVSVEQAFQEIKKEVPAIDFIVHMAGIYNLDSLVEISEQAFSDIFQINLFAIYRVNRIFLPLLKKGGRILITTSELAPLNPLPFTGIYAVTKAAADTFARSLQMELQLLGYKVILLRPGAVDTGLLEASVRALESFCANTRLYSCNAERFRKIVNSIEARNIPPEKIAEITGKVLTAKHPRQIYSINRNPLLLMMNLLPKRLQSFLIKKLLEDRG